VSEPVALAMAEGALTRIGADLAVSVTGVAGPDGGTEEKPVGTVWIGIADSAGSEARRTVFGGGRQEIRARAAQTALFLMLRRMESSR
jgi:PncC family amidohydrolase